MLHGESRVGRSYVVDIECVMSAGVPCCERFSTVVRYCMKRVAADVTRLSVTGKVRYHKPVWTFMKSTQHADILRYLHTHAHTHTHTHTHTHSTGVRVAVVLTKTVTLT